MRAGSAAPADLSDPGLPIPPPELHQGEGPQSAETPEDDG